MCLRKEGEGEEEEEEEEEGVSEDHTVRLIGGGRRERTSAMNNTDEVKLKP